MRIVMTSPMLRRRRQADRRWNPQSRLVGLLGVSLAADCISALLPEVNGIGQAGLRSGVPATLVRATDGSWLSAQTGLVRRLPPDGWRTEGGIYAATTNLCLQSEGLSSSPWASVDGVSVALDGSVLGPLAKVFKLTDPGTGSGGSIQQTLSGLSDGQPHTVSVFVREGTSVSFAVGMRDSTAGVWRALTEFDFVGGRIELRSSPAGSYRLEKIPLGNWYRVSVTAPTAVAANLNKCILYVTRVSVVQSGNLYMTGAQVQTGRLEQPYLPTTTAASSRSADQVTLPADPRTQAATFGMVVRVLDHAGTPCLLHEPGTAGDNNRLTISVSPTTGLNIALYDSSGAVKTWTQNGAPTDRAVAQYIIANDNAGTVQAWKNGVALSLTPGGAGSGIRDGLGADRHLGRQDMSHFLQGEMRACLQFPRALDSAEMTRLRGALMQLES